MATDLRSAAACDIPQPLLTPVTDFDAETAAAERVILGLRLDTGIPLATAHEPPLAASFGWALTAELIDVTPDDRVVLTTRGRLLSNELFGRLV